jgi:predicted amidohydrolase
MIAPPRTWWVVFNPYRNEAPAIRHEYFATAQKEAERICRVEGVKVHVLKCEGTWFPPGPPEPRWEVRR